MQYGKEEICALLKECGISYEIQEHPAVHTMAEAWAAGIRRRGEALKNLFLKDGKGRRHILVSVPEEKQVSFCRLEQALGVKKLGMASEERLARYLGLERGCVSPFGLLNDEGREVTVVFDRGISRAAVVGIHPNVTTATVWLKFGDLLELLEKRGHTVIFLPFSSETEEI